MQKEKFQRDNKQIPQDIVERSFDFALSIISFAPLLKQTEEGRILRKQLLRAGTSIGANIEEAQAGSSKEDFTYRMSVALREARETHYWLRLIERANLSTSTQLPNLTKEADEVKRILGAIVSKSRGSRKP